MTTAQRCAGAMLGGVSGRVNTIVIRPLVGAEAELLSGQVPASGVTRMSVPALIQMVGVLLQKTFAVRAAELRGWYSTCSATGRPESSAAVTRTSFSVGLAGCAGPCAVRIGALAGVTTPPALL